MTDHICHVFRVDPDNHQRHMFVAVIGVGTMTEMHSLATSVSEFLPEGFYASEVQIKRTVDILPWLAALKRSFTGDGEQRLIKEADPEFERLLALSEDEELPAWLWPSPDGSGWVDAWNGHYTDLAVALREGAAGVGRQWILRPGEGIERTPEPWITCLECEKAQHQRDQGTPARCPTTRQPLHHRPHVPVP